MSKDFLFDIECFKEGEKLYQVRKINSNDDTDMGKILATFVDRSHCRLMKKMITMPEGYELMIAEYTKGEGITDLMDIDVW